MKISEQRIVEIVKSVRSFRMELERLHQQGEGGNGCVGWPECDCRLAEFVRDIVHKENSWEYRGKQAFR